MVVARLGPQEVRKRRVCGDSLHACDAESLLLASLDWLAFPIQAVAVFLLPQRLSVRLGCFGDMY